jgi:ABC-type nitrate/sulfonate/bicarbonate transport system substrate-binding protein
MKILKITGVPEHFNYPWVKVVESQPFLDRGTRLEWIEESRGSGQMNKALRANETDLAIVLTESFLKDFEAGNPSKIIGFHVNSPLVWGIHMHAQSQINSLKELKEHNFLISRIGSGSHLMSLVLAERENWDAEKLSFSVIDNLPGALQAMDATNPELFLWEKYTTKPWVDRGELKRIGEVPSPWPCFVIVATKASLDKFGVLIMELRNLIYDFSQKLQTDPATVETIAREYNLQETDVRDWLNQTKWATNKRVSMTQLGQSMEHMKRLGILNSKLEPADFLTVQNLTLID